MVNSIIPSVATRFNIGVMMFTACMVCYMLRVNISINIVDMVQHIPKNDTKMNSSVSSCIRHDVVALNTTLDEKHVDIYKTDVTKADFIEKKKYKWDSNTQALILGSYFWGYILSCMVSGTMAEYWGPRNLVGYTSILSGILTIISPLAADLHYAALIACRFFIGLAGGALYPSLHCLVASWAPPAEKGKFIGALMGGTFGTVVTWSLCGVIISSLGWQWAFYIPGAIMIAWSIIWFLIVYNSPDEHPRISEGEKSYILTCIGDTVSKNKPLLPLKSILTSVPFWSFTILHFGNLWGLYFLLTLGPKYISQVLGFNIKNAGFISGLPYMARLLMAFIFGAIGDFLRKKNCMSITKTRKTFTIFSHILPGILLIILTYVGCDQVLSVAILTASLGINGAATITNLQNHQDIAPNYAGSLYGLANCIGSTSGFITPVLVGYFTKDNNGIAEWRYVFLIGASVYIISAIFFIIFGTAKTQKWNKKEDKPKDSTNSITNTNNCGEDNVAYEVDVEKTKI